MCDGHDARDAGLDGGRGTAPARARAAPRAARRPGAARGASRSAVSPWPGKCLAQAATPADCRPSTQAAACRATSAGSAPKLRTPMTGLSGEELTSTSGARSRSDAERARARVPMPAADRARESPGRRAGRARRCPAYGEPVRVVQPGDVAALLVDREEHVRASASRRSRAQRRPAARGSATFVAVEADRRRARRQTRAPASRARSVPAKPGMQGARRRASAAGEAHPFTAPPTSPLLIRPWTNRKKMMTGHGDQRRGGHHLAPVGLPRRAGLDEAAQPQRQGRRLLLVITTRATVNSFQAWRNA